MSQYLRRYVTAALAVVLAGLSVLAMPAISHADGARARVDLAAPNRTKTSSGCGDPTFGPSKLPT